MTLIGEIFSGTATHTHGHTHSVLSSPFYRLIYCPLGSIDRFNICRSSEIDYKLFFTELIYSLSRRIVDTIPAKRETHKQSKTPVYKFQFISTYYCDLWPHFQSSFVNRKKERARRRGRRLELLSARQISRRSFNFEFKFHFSVAVSSSASAQLRSSRERLLIIKFSCEISIKAQRAHIRLSCTSECRRDPSSRRSSAAVAALLRERHLPIHLGAAVAAAIANRNGGNFPSFRSAPRSSRAVRNETKELNAA